MHTLKENYPKSKSHEQMKFSKIIYSVFFLIETLVAF